MIWEKSLRWNLLIISAIINKFDRRPRGRGGGCEVSLAFAWQDPQSVTLTSAITAARLQVHSAESLTWRWHAPLPNAPAILRHTKEFIYSYWSSHILPQPKQPHCTNNTAARSLYRTFKEQCTVPSEINIKKQPKNTTKAIRRFHYADHAIIKVVQLTLGLRALLIQ